MNDIQRKLLEDKIKKLCKNCETIFDEKLGDPQPGIEEQIDKITGFATRRDLKLCSTCVYFLNADESQFEEIVGDLS